MCPLLDIKNPVSYALHKHRAVKPIKRKKKVNERIKIISKSYYFIGEAVKTKRLKTR